MRTYETTHPWLKFTADYRRLSYKTWIRLGEAQAKCEHISGVPLLPVVAGQLHSIYLAKGVLATTAIEGNTLTEDQVQRRIRGDLSLPPSQAYLGQEIDNVLAACNIIASRIFDHHDTELTPQDIRDWNQLILRDLPRAEEVIPGAIRTHSVGVGRYRGAPAEDCAYLLERFCNWLNHEFSLPDATDRTLFGLLKAIYAHIYFAWIHPFADGNGRTARLIEFHILLSSGVPSAAAHLLSNHYNQTRSEYYRQLDKTSQSGGQLEDFIAYALQGFVDGLRTQLDVVRWQQIIVHWRDYIYAHFRDQDTLTARRRRRLVLDLTDKFDDGLIPVAAVRHVSTRIAEAYAGKTDKTVQRDLTYLVQAGLLLRTGKGFSPNLGLVLAFRPETMPPPTPPTAA